MTTTLLLRLCLSRVFIFPLISQPLRLGLAIIVSTMFICVIIALYLSSWYGFILFLIYVGGLLVIFAYVATLSPNTLFGGAGGLFFLLAAQFILPGLLYFTPFLDLKDLSFQAQTEVGMTFLKACGFELASPLMVSILIRLAVVLLINLVVVVKICFYQQRALRPYKRN